MAEGLVEVRDFLRAPGNEDEVVVLYLENQMEDDPVAHEQAASVIAPCSVTWFCARRRASRARPCPSTAAGPTCGLPGLAC